MRTGVTSISNLWYTVQIVYRIVFFSSVLNFVLFVLFSARTNITPHEYLYVRGCGACSCARGENIGDENL